MLPAISSLALTFALIASGGGADPVADEIDAYLDGIEREDAFQAEGKDVARAVILAAFGYAQPSSPDLLDR